MSDSIMNERRTRPQLCPCPRSCKPIYNALAFDERIETGDLSEGYSGDCIGQTVAREYIVNGNLHTNDLNHCLFTPLKGIVQFQVCKDDLESMLTMLRAVLAEIDPMECARCQKNRRFAHFVIVNDERLCCDCARRST